MPDEAPETTDSFTPADHEAADQESATDEAADNEVVDDEAVADEAANDDVVVDETADDAEAPAEPAFDVSADEPPTGEPPTDEPAEVPAETVSRPRRRRAASRPAGPPIDVPEADEPAPVAETSADEPEAPADDAPSEQREASASDATVYPDGAVVTRVERRPARRRATRPAGAAPAVEAPPAPEAAPQPELPSSETSAHTVDVVAAQAAGADESSGPQRPARRRRAASRRQGPPASASDASGDGNDLAAAVARRVADAAPHGEREAHGVAPDERDRKLQNLRAALSGADNEHAEADAQSDAESDQTPEVSATAEESPFDNAAERAAEPDETASDDEPSGADADHEQPDGEQADGEQADGEDSEDEQSSEDEESSEEDSGVASRRRRRRRGGRRRRRGGESDDAEGDDASSDADESGTDATGDENENSGADDQADESGEASDGSRRRRRRRRRRGEDTSGADDDPSEVVVRVREPRSARSVNDEVTGIEGSTRMEAKRQRRKEGRAAGRSRRPILSEAEFLSRRESVTRKLLIRQRDDYTQLAVLEDDILVEHYVDRASATSLIGNIYLGRIQNVLPSMEAVFIDIGRGRNAVLYAGEVDWDSHGAVGDSKKVEQVFKSGQTVLVQVTKDPVGAKGARLTNHISLPGRYVVYSPGGHLSGISRKLADTERHRLRDILGDLVGDDESVIVRTAAEGASEDELVRDVNRLKAQWEAIQKKVKAGSAPQLLYAEPDLTVRIVRDLFTEDFNELVVSGNGSSEDAYDSIGAYVSHVAPHLADRLKKWDAEADGDLFAKYRIDEQIAKALERKVFLPSGGSLVIDRTEAMTVIDVNTGKFTGSGGNLEATVTSNNLEAAEEVVRQLRLRDIGGIIVVDFIDMVLPSNRELLLRRLVECLGRDRTRHQVAEVTSLGLVQMTRKKIGTGLAEAFTEQCDCCGGRGFVRHDEPVESQAPADGGERRSGTSTSRRGGRRRSASGSNGSGSNGNAANGSKGPEHKAEAVAAE